MKSVLKRLDVLDGELSPKQVVLKCLCAMAEQPDFDRLVARMWSDDFTDWLKRIAKGKSDKYKREVKGGNKVKVSKEYRKSRQEFVYLYTLAFLPCQHLEMDRYRYLYKMTALAYIYQDIVSQKHLETPKAEKSLHSLRSYKYASEKLLMEMKADQYAEREISGQFFDGTPLYLAEQREFLEEKAALVKQLILLFNDLMLDYLWKFETDGMDEEHEVLTRLMTNFDEIESAAKKKGYIQLEKACCEAKIKVYESEDRTDDVLKTFHETFKFK